MISIDPKMAWSMFIGTLPILTAVLIGVGALVWNAISVKAIRRDITVIRHDIGEIKERLAVVEDRTGLRPHLVRP
jgi:hypothetical protein